MKADTMRTRPDYRLLKLTDTVSLFHYQMPRFLMEDRRYCGLSLEAKIIYMLIFNRFQLSKLNGWVNEAGEVFVVYTRKELMQYLNIGEKRITAAMQDLAACRLLWERRCGRGFANQIYLAAIEMDMADAKKATGPMEPSACDEDCSAPRPAEATVQGTASTASAATAEPPITPLLNHRNGGSSPAKTTPLDPPKQPPSIKDLRDKDNQVCLSDARAGVTDGDLIAQIIERAELETLPDDEASVFADAIERLYFSESVRVGGAVFPQERIRHHMGRINYDIVQNAYNKITANTEAVIKKSSAYVMAVLFNSIMENGSDLLVDPYLNSLRRVPKKGEDSS